MLTVTRNQTKNHLPPNALPRPTRDDSKPWRARLETTIQQKNSHWSTFRLKGFNGVWPFRADWECPPRILYPFLALISCPIWETHLGP